MLQEVSGCFNKEVKSDNSWPAGSRFMSSIHDARYGQSSNQSFLSVVATSHVSRKRKKKKISKLTKLCVTAGTGTGIWAIEGKWLKKFPLIHRCGDLQER